MFRSSEKALGIDIGRRFIKIVGLNHRAGALTLDKYVVQRTPSQIIKDGVIEYPEELASIIKSLLIEHDMKHRRAAISFSLNDGAGLVTKMEVPRLSTKEILKVIAMQVEDETGHRLESLYGNFTTTKTVALEGKETAEILFAAAHKECADRVFSVLKAVGLRPSYAEIDIFSSMRALFREGRTHSPKDATVLVDIGDIQSRFFVARTNSFDYLRTIPLGGGEWISKAAEFLGGGLKEAEEALHRNGVAFTEEATLPVEVRGISKAISESVGQVVEELKNTVEFYEEMQDKKVGRVILLGGGARLKGLRAKVSSSLGIPCENAKPGTHLILSSEQQEELSDVWPSIAVAVGLAMKEASLNA